MAKQRGIHQIKGKINNLCYYEQKYVRGGLIRRINEAMSERLKTDPVFERTRIANTIFGGCSTYAKYFLSFFGSRSTFLFLPYRQSILTKLFQKNLVDNTSGVLIPNILARRGSSPNIAILLDHVIKNKLSLDFPIIPRLVNNLDLDADYVITLPSSALYDYLNKYGGLGVKISYTRPNYIYSMDYSSNDGAYFEPDRSEVGRLTTLQWFPGDGDLELNFHTGDIDDAFTFWIIYISPIAFNISGRYIIKNTGSTCGMIQFIAS